MQAPVNPQSKRGLIVGIANDASTAYGCAKVMQAGGAKLAKRRSLP